jgi:hypothetical protein
VILETLGVLLHGDKLIGEQFILWFKSFLQ